jgi:hypothetical protein
MATGTTFVSLGNISLTIFKESDDHDQEWAAYNPELNYIGRIKMLNSLDELYDVIIPHYKQQRGYQSFLRC